MMTKEEFNALVRDVLKHLFDYARLEKHPLVRWLPPSSTSETQAQRLSRVIVQTIEQLDPGDDFFYGSKERRSYTILWNRYVEMMSVDEVLDEIGLSHRQFHRDHSQAVEALANVLWQAWKIEDQNKVTLVVEDKPTDISELLSLAQEEAYKLVVDANVEQYSITSLVADVLHMLESFIEANHVTLKVDLSTDLPQISGIRVATRQILIQLVSHAINAAPGSTIFLQDTVITDAVILHLRVETVEDNTLAKLTPEEEFVLAMCQSLADLNNALLEFKTTIPNTWEASLSLFFQRALTVLVVDDSEGLIDLFKRYVRSTHYQVHGAHTVQEALTWLEKNQPDIIMLDIMMPEQDGYEALQKFRHLSRFVDTPIIICSIVADPGLAHSLGADFVLKKPVSRQDLLAALEKIAPGPPSLKSVAKIE